MPGSTEPKSAAERAARAQRFFAAHKALETREGADVSLDEIGRRYAAIVGADKAVDGSVIRRWFKALSEPRGLRAWAAIGEVLGESPAYLAFGIRPAPVRRAGQQPVPPPTAAGEKAG